MKRQLVLCCFFIFSCFNALCQENMVTVKLNDLFSSNQTSRLDEVSFVSPLVTPEGESKNLHLTLAISFDKKIKIGYWTNELSYFTSNYRISSTNSGSDNYTNISSQQIKSKIGAFSGYRLPLIENEKILVLFDNKLGVRYDIESRVEKNSMTFDENHQYLSKAESLTVRPSAWEIGVESGLMAYYKIGRIFFGLGLSNYFYYERLKGSFSDTDKVVNSAGDQSTTHLKSYLNNHAFGRRFLTSFNISLTL